MKFLAAHRHGVAHKEYGFSTRRATVSTKSGQAVLWHVDGVLRGLHCMARVPRRRLTKSQAHKKYEFMAPLRCLDCVASKKQIQGPSGAPMEKRSGEDRE